MIIGSGTPAEAHAFQAEYAPDLAVFTDPERATFAAAGFTDSLLASLSLGMIGRALGAYRAGFSQGRVQGSALQQGGVLVLGRGPELLARYSSKSGGDHPTTEWLLSALG